MSNSCLFRAKSPLFLFLALMCVMGSYQQKESSYHDLIASRIHALNVFRDTDEAISYGAKYQEMRQISMHGNIYYCFDATEDIEMGTTQCSRWGIFQEDYGDATSGDTLQALLTSAKTLTDGANPPLKWSHELAHSASLYTEDLSGCNVWRPNVMYDTEPDYYLKDFATYKNHKRTVIYPERHPWRTPEEFAFDVILDDYSSSSLN